MPANYAYGATVLHDNVNFFLQEKDFSLPAFQQSLFPVGRGYGVYKSGERQNQRTLRVQVKVISTLRSRVDLENILDLFFMGLALRQQQLTLHALDGRYWLADCTTIQYTFTSVISAVVTLTFVAYQPFAYTAAGPGGSSAMSYGPLSQQAGSLQANLWITPPFQVVGAGTVPAYPLVAIQNTGVLGVATLTTPLGTGTAYTTLQVSALPFAWNNDIIVIAGQFQAGGPYTSQYALLTGANAAGATSLAVSSFIANANYTSGTTRILATGSVFLLSPLTSGTHYYRFPTTPMPFACGPGTTLLFNDLAGHTQTVTMPNGCSVGQGEIYVNTFQANFSYPTNTALIPNSTLSSLTLSQLTSGIQLDTPNLNLVAGDTFYLNANLFQPGIVETLVTDDLGNTYTFDGTLPYMTTGPTVWQITCPPTVAQPRHLVSLSWVPLYQS